ncbi:hypothetical protein FACS1894132_12440 [Clostridia bacterium]|nr:hypothetical protein FACS1894132_12440 [Clostridia bacterium]
MDYQNLQPIGEGKTAKIYQDGDHAFKVYNSDYAKFVEHEAKMQTYAYNEGLPVPAVYGVSQASKRWQGYI